MFFFFYFFNSSDTILGGLCQKKEEVSILAVSDFVSVKQSIIKFR